MPYGLTTCAIMRCLYYSHRAQMHALFAADLERKRRYLREKEAKAKEQNSVIKAQYKAPGKSGDDGFVDIFM